VVREPKIVDAVYTKNGWKAMQEFFSRNDWNMDDEWVLGEGAKAASRGVNIGDVRNAYQADYIREWRDFVKSASVVGLGGPTDASRKLDKLTGNRSPLFELLCEVSENTSETSTDIAIAFAPVNDVVKAPCRSLVAQESTKAYVAALNDFKLCIDQFQEDPKNPATQREDSYRSCKIKQSPPVQTQARVLVKSIDHEAHLDECVVNLLKLLGPCGLVKGPVEPHPPDEFCIALNRLSSKFPFRADSNDDAGLGEFEQFFRPGGVLSKEIAKGIGKGPRANLVRSAQMIQNALYPNGSSLQYRFTVTADVPKGMKSLSLNLDGGQLSANEGVANSKEFVWPGAKHEAELSFGNSKSNLGPFSGPWAIFSLLGNNYNWTTSKGGTFHLESKPFTGPDGSAFRDILELRTAGVPLFRRGYLSPLRCSR